MYLPTFYNNKVGNQAPTVQQENELKKILEPEGSNFVHIVLFEVGVECLHLLAYH